MNFYQEHEYQNKEEIDLYLNGLLNDQEIEEFEEKLRSDPKLAYEFEKLRITRSLFKNQNLRDHFFLLSKEELTQKRKWLLSNYNLSIKIGVAVAILSAFIFIYNFLTINSKDLYAQADVPYSIDAVEDKPVSHSSILYNYFTKNFQDAVHIYENKELESNEDNFIAGICYLEIGLPEKAIECFRKIIVQAEKGGENEYLDDAEYYSGVANLKILQVDAAYWYFSKIYHDPVHAYHEKVNKWFYWKLKILKFRRKLF